MNRRKPLFLNRQERPFSSRVRATRTESADVVAQRFVSQSLTVESGDGVGKACDEHCLGNIPGDPSHHSDIED